MASVTVARTIRITVEIDTVMVVRRATTASAWCPDCQAEVDTIRLGGEGLVAPGAAEQVQRWLETGKLHHWQPPGEPERICLSSLMRCFEEVGIVRMRVAKEAT